MAFITKIADYIIDNYDLTKESLVVIFPNKRAALNLRSELSERIRKRNINVWLPQMLSIQEAMMSWSGLQLVENIDIVYELINIINNKSISLNSNIFGIATQMLKDFDEIDQYDIDAKKIFNHINDVKKLEMWTPDLNNEIESSYIRFFSSLYGYYNELRNILLRNNCGYYGMISRTTSELKDELIDIIGDKKIIFAGFNAMTKTEEDVIVRLTDSGKAVLLWDLDKYYFDDTTQEAGLFARNFFDRHPKMTRNFIGDNLSRDKQINIIATSGNSIQTNALQLQLEKEIRDNKTPHNNEAIVLADESLLIPVLNSLPKPCSDIQVTMGFPFSETIINNFINELFYLQENINPDDNKIYFWSFLKIINNDIIKNIFNKDELNKLSKWKNSLLNRSTYHIYTTDFETFRDSKDIYTFLTLISKKWNSSNDCINILQNILGSISVIVDDIDKSNFLKNQISVAGKIINKIGRLVRKHEGYIQITDIKTLFILTASESSISLKGTKDGLQIMGLLETRNLDFDTLHILSVNEGILPQSKSVNSLIPYDLRILYKLPIYKNKQAVYAYHFYRLIQNAKNVNIYYNTLPDATGEGEASRFILQLTNELPKRSNNIEINEITYKSPDIKINNISKIEVRKTDEIIEKIKHKLTNGSGLSPTSISCYLNCPLQFYLKYIEKIQDNTPEELIQSNVIGSIIHDTFQNLYEHFGDNAITSDSFDEIVTKHLDDAYKKALTNNKFPNGLPDTGFNYLSKMLTEKLINSFISFERKQLLTKTISILELEKEMVHHFNINGVDVKLTGRADRIDMIDNTIRVLDYKTGNVKDADMVVSKTAASLEKLTPKSLQLIIYKYLYLKQHCDIDLSKVNVEPGIIALRKLSNGIFVLNNNSDIFNDNSFIETCDELFRMLFTEILDKGICFKQIDDEKKCIFCDFKEICKR